MPDSELGPRLPPGPTWMVGSEAIISASISSTGLGTVLSYMLIRSPIDSRSSALPLLHTFDCHAFKRWHERHDLGPGDTHPVRDRP